METFFFIENLSHFFFTHNFFQIIFLPQQNFIQLSSIFRLFCNSPRQFCQILHNRSKTHRIRRARISLRITRNYRKLYLNSSLIHTLCNSNHSKNRKSYIEIPVGNVGTMGTFAVHGDKFLFGGNSQGF